MSRSEELLYVDIVSYINALRQPLHSPLRGVEPIYEGGELCYTSGGGGVVFKVTFRGEHYGLKCFTTISKELIELYESSRERALDQEGRFIAPFQFIPDAIVVDTWIERLSLPVVLIKWIDGGSLGANVREACYSHDSKRISSLVDSFLHFAHDFLSSDIIHSDIKCDNIICSGDSFKLIDVDALTDSKRNQWYENKLISPWYNHPLLRDHNRLRDHYPMAIIVAALLAIESDTSLTSRFSYGDNFIFTPALLIEGTDPAFEAVEELFESSPEMRSLGEYITSKTLPNRALTPLLFDIMATRGLARYDMSDHTTLQDGLYSIRGYNLKYGFAKSDGSVTISPRYDDIREFREGLAAVAIGARWHFIDSSGRAINCATYREATSFSSGAAAVKEDQL